MSTKTVLEFTDIAGLVVCLSIIVQLFRSKAYRDFKSFTCLLSTYAAGSLITIPILYFRKELGIGKVLAFHVYFNTKWTLFFVTALLLALVIYRLFQGVMAPFEGLQRIGSIVFRWVAVVSVVLSLGLALGPHVETLAYFRMLIQRMEQGSSVLTLCLLLFVCSAARPLGITYRSRFFGVSLGLGVMATSMLVEGVWMSSNATSSVYSPIYLLGSFGMLFACAIWGWYFMVPEPVANMVLLPATSPYFLWNRVSEALGDHPGYVAISGFRPDMLEPAELTVLTAASVAARERRSREAIAEAAERVEAAATKASLQKSGMLHSVAIQR